MLLLTDQIQSVLHQHSIQGKKSYFVFHLYAHTVYYIYFICIMYYGFEWILLRIVCSLIIFSND